VTDLLGHPANAIPGPIPKKSGRNRFFTL
jgi:hypothetical protein